MHDNAQGGNDHLTGSDFLYNSLLGDAGVMDGDSRGGNDTLIVGFELDFVNQLYGDATVMLDNARGGNDTLIGGASGVASDMYGDSFLMVGNTRGGNDTLVSG